MASLTVWKFDSPHGAEEVLQKLKDLATQQLIQIEDAAIVSWPQGKKKPKTHQTRLTGAGALSGAFWGMLFGLIFFVPLFGMAVGAGIGALTGHFSNLGISEDFIKQVRGKVTEGTSALFLLTDQVTIDKVADAFKGTKMELIQSNLSAEQEKQLRDVFGEE
ncbi:MAG: DUF1269 domain-containing protein [Candidatus Promineifilaceae bacterium]|jgi:uncharacterized membrane protein